MSYDKNYFKNLRGCKFIFQVVSSNPDLKVQFVNHYADYCVKITNDKSFPRATIRIQIVDSNPDIKLEKVSHFGDFEIYMQ